MTGQSKFRVWDVTNKKFLPQSHFAVLGNGKLIVSNSGYYTDFTNTNKDDYVVQQFTGLFDKNGKEIYEGDIIELCRSYNYGWAKRGTVLVVVWDSNELCFYIGNIQLTKNKKVKIVDNILENPELLK